MEIYPPQQADKPSQIDITEHIVPATNRRVSRYPLRARVIPVTSVDGVWMSTRENYWSGFAARNNEEHTKKPRKTLHS